MGQTAHPESKHKEPNHVNGEDCRWPCGIHAMVGGSYPHEFSFSCRWCGDDDEDGQCRFCYYTEMPDDHQAACSKCGECDCSIDTGSQQAYLCQLVGECAGLAYDVVIDAVKGEVICLNCFETTNWY